MTSLIEQLTAETAVRPDKKRIEVIKRPPPTRLREVLEVFGAMGNAASFEGAMRSIEMRDADPKLLLNAVLGRWPTADELRTFGEEGFKNARYMRQLLLSDEFRAGFMRRVLDSFADKRRFLHVRIPSCAGQHVLKQLAESGPCLPLDITSETYGRSDTLGPLLGRIFGRVAQARGIGISLPHLAPFVDPPEVGPVKPGPGGDPLNWQLNQAPARAWDLLFAIVRPPTDLALSQVNGTLTRLRHDPAARGLGKIRRLIGELPPGDKPAEWKTAARRLLAAALPENPVCAALADGTLDGTLAACRRVPVELVHIDEYEAWLRPNIEATPMEPVNVSERFLEAADLTPADHAVIAARMGEDVRLWGLLQARLRETGLPMVRGFEL